MGRVLVKGVLVKTAQGVTAVQIVDASWCGSWASSTLGQRTMTPGWRP